MPGPDGIQSVDLGRLAVPFPSGSGGTDPPVLGAGAPYARLTKKHKEYDPGLLQELQELYVGGWVMIQNAEKYAPAMPGENPARHANRCKKTSYQPYFGQIVNEFVSDLFGQPLIIGPAADADDPNTPGTVPDKQFYGAFANDVDNKNHSFVDLMGDVLTTALVKRWGIVALDAPKLSPGEPEPVTRADESKAGTDQVYCYEVPVEQLINWKVEGDGFAFCVIHTKDEIQEDPLGLDDITTETFMVWKLDEDGAAIWSKYEIKYLDTKRPEPTTIVPLVDQGTTSFKRIPILRMELSHGLWVGNKIGPQALEHYSRRCELVGAESDACYAIPYVKRGPEIPSQGGAIMSETQQDPNRGENPVQQLKRKGWMAVGSGDEVGFAEPSGGCFTIVHNDLDALKDAMFSVCHQMAASVRPTPSAMGRSGISKQEDGKSTAKVLKALGKEVRTFALKIYKAIADARGDDVVWQAHGLDSYEVDDRESVLEEAVSLDTIDIPSETFKRMHYFQVAQKLLSGVDPQTLAQIKKEIEAGVSEKMEHEQIASEAQAEQDKAKTVTAQNTQQGIPAPRPPGTKPPMQKSPMANGPPPPKVGGQSGARS
jgi:hypothetical protein